MDMLPLISVIVPAYNRERTIKKCVESILAQSYFNLEVLVVDDGSTDETGKIVNQIAKADKRVKYIFQTNQGPGAARNAGIDKAEGDYIGFIDSDDWADPHMYAKLLNLCHKYNAEISCCNILSHFPDGSTEIRVNDPCEIVVFDKEEAMKELITHKHFANNVVTKLYKKVIFEKNRFYTEGIYEDAEIMPRLVYCANKLVYTGEPLYRHSNFDGSILRSKFTEKRFDLEKVYSERFAFYKKINLCVDMAAEQYIEKALSVLSMAPFNVQYRRERNQLRGKIMQFYGAMLKQVKFANSIRKKCSLLRCGLIAYDTMVVIHHKAQ